MRKPHYNGRVESLNRILDWSFKAGSIAKIPVRIHIFLPFFIFFVCAASSSPMWWDLSFSLGIFGSVLLHELGHALTARSVGLNPTCIMLHPFGGWASYNGRSTGRQQFEITAAGPAVNFALAAVLWLLGGLILRVSPEAISGDFLQLLGRWNLIIGALNLIPALPFDGGHLVEAVLVMRGKGVRSTQIAATIGMVSSLVLIVAGIALTFDLLIWFPLFGFINSAMTYRSLEGKLPKPFKDQKERRDRERREREKTASYLDEVRKRERDREERERLRKLFGDSVEKE